MFLFFFFNDTATTEIYTLSLHDALPIWATSAAAPARSATASKGVSGPRPGLYRPRRVGIQLACWFRPTTARSEEHTSELQSRQYLVCRLLLEKKKNTKKRNKQYIKRHLN